jgi:methyl-accepting chemotaxis protein
MFIKTINKLNQIYKDEYFLTQKKVHALFYFSLILAFLMIAILFAFFIFKRDTLFQAGVVIVTVFFACLATILILKAGYYNAAAHFITGLISISVTAGLLVKINRDAYAGYTTFIYFMLAVMVAAILFCKRYFFITISIIFISADILFYFLAKENLDPISLKAAKVGLLDSTFAIIFVFVAGLSLNWIVNESLMRSDKEAKGNADNYNRVQELLKSLSGASTNLASSSVKLSETASSFSQNTQSQAASAEEIMATIEEVSAGVDNVAGGAKEQYDRMKDLLDRLKVLSGTIVEMGTTIGKASNTTRDITGYATEGEKSLHSMNESMQKINSSSNEMTNIVGIINDISDRINLLSLNAAIRAGDAGRGFAVVADEISKLADQTSTSIKDIESHIKLNNNEITRGASTMVDAVKTISKIIEGVNSINSMIDDISKQMTHQQDLNSLVNAEAKNAIDRSDGMKMATEEQKTAVTEISTSISNVNELTQLNSQGAEKLFEHARHVKDLAENLNDQMTQFEEKI